MGELYQMLAFRASFAGVVLRRSERLVNELQGDTETGEGGAPGKRRNGEPASRRGGERGQRAAGRWQPAGSSGQKSGPLSHEPSRGAEEQRGNGDKRMRNYEC